MKKLLWTVLGAGLVLAACSQPLEGTGAGRDTSSPTRGITSFSLAGVQGEILGTTIYVRDVPLYTAEHTVTDFRNAVPAIGYIGGTLDPDPLTPRNFATPVIYNLATADGITLDYTVVVTARPLNSVAEIETYLPLAATVYTGTLEDPIPLPVGLELSTINWQGILSVIQSGGKYVALDISTCIASTDTAGGGLYGDRTFDPGAANTGEHRIVSLILPGAAEKIKAATDISTAAFQRFIVLKSVTAAGITEVGDYAFSECAALRSVSLPAAATIGDKAFGSCTILSSISLPAATIIGDKAFYACVSLETVNLFAARTIGDDAFYACVSLETVSLPAARTIGMNAFGACTNLETVSLPVATTVDQNVFNDCHGLREVYLPLAITIGANAFAGCVKLSSISLPSATSIGTNAFANCTALNLVNFPLARTIGNETFKGCDALRVVNLPVARTIGTSAFYDCISLETVSLPVIITITENTFSGCKALSTVSFPEATTIGSAAFNNCTALTTVNLPIATSIGTQAFLSCTALSEVNIPAATSIAWAAFSATGSNQLTVTLGALPPLLATELFRNVTSAKNAIVKVPSSATGYGSPPSDITTDCWGNGFRGGGWNGTNATNLSWGINGYVNLTIETY